MPDLFTHTIAAAPISAITKKKLPALFVLIGAIFPDLFSRAIMVLLPDSYSLYWFATVLHTPIMLILVAYVVSLFFEVSERKVILTSLLLGSAIHLFLDMLQKHYVGGYYWFFPFSYYSLEIPLFWPEEIIQRVTSIIKR